MKLYSEIISRFLFLITITIFLLSRIVTINASTVVLQNETFDNYTYSCDFAGSTTSSNVLTPFSNNYGVFSVLWPYKMTAGVGINTGIIAVSTKSSPFNTTNSLEQFTSTLKGFINPQTRAPAVMSVTINETTPLSQKVLMEANYLFTEAKFSKTVFLAKNTSSYSSQVQYPFKIIFSNIGMIDVYSGNSEVVKSVPWEINKWYHVALLADMENSIISVYVNGERLIENSAFTALTSKIIGQIFLSTITGLPTVTDTDKSAVFIDDVKITAGDNITYDVLNSNADIVSTAFYILDNSLLTIKQVPKATTVANFKSKVKLAPNTTLNLYDMNGILLSDISEVTDTTKAVVTARNGVTKKMYSISVVPNPEFKADGQVIKNIANAYGKTLEATVEVINDGTPYPLRAILALYNNYGKMIKSSMSEHTQAQSGTTTFTTNINVPNPVAGETYKAKFMLWNLLKPVREVVELKQL